ncbi:MAG: N-6 DNA methylase [Planctomycetaceae bacterium]|nr:N-6 DNA methylase [Planctomycetaceae bacterium]
MNLDSDKINSLRQLVDLFSSNIAQYKGVDYDELNVRVDFIDKFFELLDWDVRNEQGFSEIHREVIREFKIKKSGGQKVPDYCFRISPSQFFVEAKKPSINIKDNAESAIQLRRYAYTAKLPLSILTDFEEFAVYDTRIKINKNDKASTARIFYCTFNEYEQHFDYIYNTFSKIAIQKGSFEHYVKENKKTKGVSEVDQEFLNFIEGWRIELAKNIVLNNPELSIFDLNISVQKIIDRILFLRIAEDKGIESYGVLQKESQKNSVYKYLNYIFSDADEKYNAGLFKHEKWLEKISIDDKILYNIINSLYFPECPYALAVLPVEILGNIYEKFLGNVIRLTAGHRVKVEEKPEVRKAGGVFYTPQYIVDYIVQNTVGVLIDNKTPDEISKITIVDPACGSGSFLVGAYQFLLNYHLDFYTRESNKKSALKRDKIFESGSQTYKLTIAEKQRILQNNIFGVDIDSQAVEVTKLSLYLKLLENEGKEAEGQLFSFTDLRLLPDIDNNIKCGNSLIGTDFFAQQNFNLSENEQVKINCFDWEKEFIDIFKKNGGFDIVIGNPPYVIIFDEQSKKYIEKVYPEFQRNNNLYIAFMMKGIFLLRTGGIFSFITPNTYLKGEYYHTLRSQLAAQRINEIVDFGNEKIFKDTNVFTAICNVSKDKPKKQWLLKSDFQNVRGKISKTSEYFVVANPLIEKLSTYAKFDDVLYVKDVGYNYWSIGRGKVRGGSIGSRIFYFGTKKHKKDIPYCKGSNIQRYILNDPQQYLRHNYDGLLYKNDKFRFTPDLMETKPKIIYRQTSGSLIGTIDNNGYHNDKTVHIILPKDNLHVDIRYILGIFNSKLLNYCYENFTEEQGRIFAQVKIVNIKKLPFVIPPNKTTHDNIVSLVDKMLQLKLKEHTEQKPQMKTMLQRQINGLDQQIDKAVYQLYGLAEEEVKIVEGK